MKLDDLGYAKSEGKRIPMSANVKELQDEQPYTATHIDADVIAESDYVKGSPTIEATVIFIISGGSRRERDYFHPIFIETGLRRIRIAFRSKEGQGLKPYELKQLAEDFVNTSTFVSETREHFQIEDGDIIYLLQDVDEFGEIIKPYITAVSETSPIKWIISNPSFEVWLFYHYFDNPKPLKDGLALNERDRSNWLKEHLNKIIPGGIQPTKALFQTKIAIQNSIKCYSETDGCPNVFCTQMHHLAIAVADAMGTELDDMLKKPTEKIEKFRRK